MTSVVRRVAKDYLSCGLLHELGFKDVPDTDDDAEKVTILRHAGEKVGEFEPWMADYIDPTKPGPDRATFKRLDSEYRAAQTENYCPGFDHWAKKRIARAIATVLGEETP